ncbi:MAG: hypothetical protein C5B58_12495 [Acidobacteria bacterium]|nr:MAG: hypothetical protein C5B58_12495 [Acidobacteriota bacterium]
MILTLFHLGEIMLSRVGKVIVCVLILALTMLAQTVPAGTHITVRTDSQINSATAHVGQSLSANLTKNLVINGKTIAKAGAPAKGKVTYVKASGRLHDPGEVTIRLTSIQLADGRTLHLSTNGFHAKGRSHTKSNVTKIGGGAAAGALIGGVAGGGKGALIGTAVGAGAGTGVAAATGKEEAVIHSETAITFTTTTTAKVK